ncbi:MAG: hypothetical protein ACK50G_02895 [bacterium]
MVAVAKMPADIRAELTLQQSALRKQADRLAGDLAEATVARDRAVARATLDSSKASQTARDTATGAVVRLEAELAATRSAIAQVDSDLAQLADEHRIATEAARMRRCADALEEAAELADVADQAAAAFVESYLAFSKQVQRVHVELPASLREAVFGGGQLLGGTAMNATANYLLSGSGVVPRPIFEPNPNRQSLQALVRYFGIPVFEAANRLCADDYIRADFTETLEKGK